MPIVTVGKYKEISPEKELYLGHEFEKNGHRSLDKRCNYCGKWFCFDITNCEKWGNNIQIGFNGWPEKIHCGSEHCQEYHRRVLKFQNKEAAELKQKTNRLFFSMMKRGMVK